MHKDLFWIATEALNNAMKHAQARNVQIIIRCLPGLMEMEIIDDGKGFDLEHIHTGGLGLENMQARAAQLGGTLTINTSPGAGTSVRVSITKKAEEYD